MLFMKLIKGFGCSVQFWFTFTVGSPGEANSATDKDDIVVLRVEWVEVLPLRAVEQDADPTERKVDAPAAEGVLDEPCYSVAAVGWGFLCARGRRRRRARLSCAEVDECSAPLVGVLLSARAQSVTGCSFGWQC